MISLTIGIIKISASSIQKEEIKIDSSDLSEDQLIIETVDKNLSVIGSKTGKKYHLPDCPGARTILEANKIFFKTIYDAEKAGYTPALNCKGLKSI